MRFFLFAVLFWIGTVSYGQTSLDWSDLSQSISFESSSETSFFPEFQKANFSLKMKALEGTEVIITGYFLKLDEQQSVYLLSKNPMASCFFCGNGGPETVIGLQFEEKPSFVIDDLLSIKGILRLNRDDPNICYYSIENADALSLK